MEKVVLKASKRDVIGKQVKALRRAGLLPAVIYGRHTEPINVSLDAKSANTALAKVTSSSLVTIDVDGKEYPVTGNPAIDSLQMERLDARTAEVKLRHAGHVLATVLRVISPDGNTMTIAYQGQDEYGDVVQYTAVFNKQ